MNGQPSGKFGKYELQKLIMIAGFLVSSGILTGITSLLTSIDFGKWSPVVMAGWNLLLAGIYLLASDNTPTINQS